MVRTATVGAVQLVAARGDKEANLQALEELVAAAARRGARVVVAPEMATTGYCWPDEAEVRPLAEPVDGPSTRRLARLCRSTGTWLVVGMPEVDEGTGLLHNTCVLVGPDGPLGAYRKVQPFLADPFWSVDGDRLPPVWETPAGRVSPLVCADVDYPEPPRAVALAGVDWLALATAWVDEPAPSATWRLRAWEDALPVVAADMAGRELGVQFSGGTCVLDHAGSVLDAVDAGPGVVVATLDLDAAARRRREVLAERRPRAYRPLALTTRWARPDRDRLYGEAPQQEALHVAVLHGPPAREAPAPPAGTELAVLPALHLVGGAPADADAAGRAADRHDEALAALGAWAARHGCEAVTSLVERVGGGLRLALVAAGPRGTQVRHATHLGPYAAWAEPGDEEELLPLERPWGRLGLLSGEELAVPETSRVLAVRRADVVAVPAAVAWPWPVDYPGTRVPLGEGLTGPDRTFAHPARLRAGDSHVWVALANDGPTTSGVFAPDHVAVPRAEVLAPAPGWASVLAPLRGPTALGRQCEEKPQLTRRRTDVFSRPLLA
ncbi:nitrilase-related carbon-nitrogen hydrolase [Vallicoccus soli]|uniref:CN hydrolase domain-containing protein n=1 Tax=Vallicoccus soli TaxID=2339232 RepID=A0A3A3ZKL7_9ACTN|nr:nitrilase-related carbon-nitrogen hydrolase [Vallicoccus soli]RJK96410.1 hypothetical protein D5H78_09280 [Vallicoccus soli]